MSIGRTLILAKGWYEEFKINRWPKPYSFHNLDHIKADCQAADKLTAAAFLGNDPLRIREDLFKWNQKHSDNQIKETELAAVCEMALIFHDLGNILETVINKDNTLVPVFLDKYLAKGAEDRSGKIAKILMENSLSDKTKERYLRLVLHLIEQTSFIVSEKCPFGLFTRMVDQIGSGLFAENKTRNRGLLEETLAENPQTEIVPDSFYNFTRLRLTELVPDHAIRQAILDIWDKKLPVIIDVPKKPIRIDKWLAKTAIIKG